MSLLMIITLIGGGTILYIFFGIGIFNYLTERLKWHDTDANGICAVIWPFFILFWVIAGWPAMGIVWISKKSRKLFRRTTAKRSVSEVK